MADTLAHAAVFAGIAIAAQGTVFIDDFLQCGRVVPGCVASDARGQRHESVIN
jgi:hypothetical protein